MLNNLLKKYFLNIRTFKKNLKKFSNKKNIPYLKNKKLNDTYSKMTNLLVIYEQDVLC